MQNDKNGEELDSKPIIKSKPKEETKAFIDWVLSPAGQDLIEEVGYYPLQ